MASSITLPTSFHSPATSFTASVDCWTALGNALNSLEYVDSIITIQLYLRSLPPTTSYPCILSIRDNTNAIGWLHKSSFDESTHSLHSSLARHLAKLLMTVQACRYSQHIPGDSNVIADSLSRDFHLPTDVLTSLILTNFTQVHHSFHICPLLDDVESWLTSTMLKIFKLQELKLEHTQIVTWHPIIGLNTPTASKSPLTLSLKPLTPSIASTYYVPSCNQSGMALSHVVMTPSKPIPVE